MSLPVKLDAYSNPVKNELVDMFNTSHKHFIRLDQIQKETKNLPDADQWREVINRMRGVVHLMENLLEIVPEH